MIQSVVVVGEIGDIEIDFSIVVVVAHRDAHGSLLVPFIIQRETRDIAHILERAIVFVAVEVLRHGVIGHR